MDKNLIFSDIEKMVNEALDEFVRKGVSVTPGAINTPAATAKNPKMHKPVVCNSAFYSKPDESGNEYLTVRLNGVHDSHKSTLQNEWAKKYGQIFKAASNQSQRVGSSAAAFDLTVFPGQEDTFAKIIPDLVQDIANLNGTNGCTYDPNSLSNLELSILGRMDEAPTEEDLKKAEERQNLNIADILSKLSDPEFVKSLGFIKGVPVSSNTNLNDIIKQGDANGWRISPLNQILVKTLLPNATFVTNAWTWDKVFNREVIDPTQFAFEVKSANDKPIDNFSRSKGAADRGYVDINDPTKNPWDVFKSLRGNLSSQQNISVQFLANIYNPNNTHFRRQKVYDISNTRLKTDANGNPMFDVFNEHVGFEDNIKGIPNAKALEYMSLQNGEENPSGNAPVAQQVQWVPQEDAELLKVIDTLRTICINKCKTAPNEVPGDSRGDTIAHYAEFYARKYVCPNRQIVKPQLITATCNAFAITLSAIYGFPVKRRGNDLSNALQDPDFKKNMTDLENDFYDLIKDIDDELLKRSSKDIKAARSAAKKNVSESINEITMNREKIGKMFTDAFLGISSQVETIDEEEMQDEVTIESIQESFYSLFDKLEHING